jgi:hypothetical protein
MSFTQDNNNDNYTTDFNGWKIIKDYIPKDKILYAPFYCDGKQKEYFKELGFEIIHEDEDFFENVHSKEYDILIDNPPFSKMKQICIELKKIDKPFILIGFSRVFLMKWFQRLFKDHLQIMIPFTRATFTHLENPKKGYTPPFGVQYYCYKMNLQNDITWLE